MPGILSTLRPRTRSANQQKNASLDKILNEVSNSTASASSSTDPPTQKLNKNDIAADSKLNEANMHYSSLFENMKADLEQMKTKAKRSRLDHDALMNKIEYGLELTKTVKKVLDEERRTSGNLHYVTSRILSLGEVAEEFFDILPTPPPVFDPTSPPPKKKTKKHYSLRSRAEDAPLNVISEVARLHHLHKELVGNPNDLANPNQLASIVALETYVQTTKEKGKLVKHWIENKMIPVQKSKFDEMIQTYKDYKKTNDKSLLHKLQWPLATHGVTPFFKIRELQEIGDKYMSAGNNFNDTGFEKELNNIKKQRAVERGYDAGMIDDVCKRTVKNYKCLLIRSRKFNYQESARHKPELRFIAENSILNTLTYLMTVATTHFQFSDTEKADKFNKNYKSIDSASDGAQLFHELVSLCNEGMGVSPIDPALAFSTDDSTVYSFRGKELVLDNLHLVNDGAKTDTKNVSSCDPNLGKHLNGMRVRLTFTMNAVGNVAPIFITVYGLSESELLEKDENGLCVVEVPGLCVGGSENIDNKCPGYISFLTAKTEEEQISMEQKNFLYYRNEIFLPWVQRLRQDVKKFHMYQAGSFTEVSLDEVVGVNNSDSPVEVERAAEAEAEEIGMEGTAVSWFDGGISQLKTIKDNEQQVKENKLRIICNKHARGCSAIQQPCDVSPAFRTIKRMLKYLCQDDYPDNTYLRQMKVLINETLQKKKVNLSQQKRESLIDLCVTLPSILAKGVGSRIVQKGFVETGMICEKTKTWPDFFKILQTCNNKDIGKAVMVQKIINDFPAMFEEQMEKGQLTDEFLLGLGYDQDKNTQGDEVHRKTSMNSEWNHRSKTISNDFQRALRKSLVTTRDERIREKSRQNYVESCKILGKNMEAENLLLSFLPEEVDPKCKERFGTVTREMFFHRKMTKDLLKPFIFVRQHDHFDDKTKMCQWNKGKIKEVTEDDDCLANQAFKLRLIEPLLKPEIDETTNVTDTNNFSSTEELMQTDDTEIGELITEDI